MKDKIIQVSGFGVENNQSTQCSYMIVGLTQSGKVVITSGDGIWADISSNAPHNQALESDGAGDSGSIEQQIIDKYVAHNKTLGW